MIQFRKSRSPLLHHRRAGRMLSIESLEARCVLSTSYIPHNLVSDQPGIAPLRDPNLVNAWGIALSPTAGNFWIADNGKDLATVYGGDVAGSPLTKNAWKSRFQVEHRPARSSTAPHPISTSPTARTRIKRLFIFASEAGDVTGWSPNVPPSSTAAQPAFQSSDNAVFKGLA